jgi:hemoglobin/transferrin/lactoferrin receptor protein
MRIRLIAALMCLPLTAVGQDFLNPVVVTATRTEQTASEVPYWTSVIGADFISGNTRRTLPEALQYTPGVLVQKTAYGHGSPIIRGFIGRQNLLLVEGVRANNSTYRSGPVQYWNTVDPYTVDHLELIKSQGSVLYGSDAVGGTVQTFTKFADFRAQPAGEGFVGGESYYEFRSNGQGSHIGRIEAQAGVGGQFGVMLGLSAKEFGDIEDSALGRMEGTGYPEEDFDLRLDWAVSKDSTVTLAHYYVNQDEISRWHRTLNNPGWTHGGHVAAPGTYSVNTYDQERSLTFLRYAGENPGVNAAIARWSATLSYQTVNDSEFQDRNPSKNDVRAADIDVNTLGFDLTLESPVGPGTLVYGFDYYHDEVDSSGYKTKSDRLVLTELLPIADNSEYDLLGIFGQYVWKPVERLEVTTGVRYTYAEALLGRFADADGVAQTDETKTWDSVVGSLRGLYHFNERWSGFGGISQAFRAPNLDDLTGNLTAKAGDTSLGSTNVEPEEFITYELGVRETGETTALQASVFYTDGRDLITAVKRSAIDSTTITTNASDAYSYGVELEGAWRFHPHWTLSGFAAWQEGRLQSPNFVGGPVSERPMTRQLPLNGSVALRWTHPSEKFWIEGRILAADTEDRITAADQLADNQRIPTGGTPGYVVAALHSGWTVNDHLDLTCGVENLTDEDYRNHGSGQNEPGLNGILGVRVTW